MPVRFTYGKRKQFKVGVASRIVSQRREELTRAIEEALASCSSASSADEEFLGNSQVSNSVRIPGASLTDALNTLSSAVATANRTRPWAIGDKSNWFENSTGDVYTVTVLTESHCMVVQRTLGTPPQTLTRTALEASFTRCGRRLDFPY